MLSELRNKVTIAAALGAAVLAVLALPATAKMQSTKVEGGLCLTEGGGRFVAIPGFPGEKIDRRLLRDIKYLKRNYEIFVTDGFSTDPVHSANGEHPIGLGLDIVPNSAKGGTWGDIDRLAEWAEPKQNSPVAPFRWVGYDGDANHGRGHHLHLSWMHSPAKFGKPADSVYTMRCPRRGPKRGDGQSGDEKPDRPESPSGGTEAGEPTGEPPPSGGTTPRLAPVAPERDGVGV